LSHPRDGALQGRGDRAGSLSAVPSAAEPSAAPPAAESPAFAYTVEPLPPGPLGRRWRWTLFHRDRLLAAGWRMAERHAMDAVRRAATHAAHEALGVRALRPERTTADRPLIPGARVRVESGAVGFVLFPRAVEAPATAA
jgi:hypothetical protein